MPGSCSPVSPGARVLGFSFLPGFFSAALAVMALHSLAPNLSDHDLHMSAPQGGAPGSNTVTCYICHRCVARPATTGSSLWDPHAGSAGDACSVERRGGNLSLMCLSCHDGAIAPMPPTSEAWFAGQRTLGAGQSEWSKKNVIGHHPYWVPYPVAGNSDFLPLGMNPACPLPLFSPSGRGGSHHSMECSTCHDVHSRDHGSYLRAPKEQFELCLCCHRELPPLSSEVFLPMQKEQKVIESGECRSCHNK